MRAYDVLIIGAGLAGQRAALAAAEKAAIERTESRGAQFRTDFPARDDEHWLKHITVSANGDRPGIGYAPVTITRWQPEERHY